MTSTTSDAATDQETSLFSSLDVYPWDSDLEFQQGIRAILNPDLSGDEKEHLVTRARCFYYSRKHGVHIDPAKYERWRAQQTKDAPNHSIVGSGGGGGQDDVVRSEEHRGASISTKLSPTPTANDASIVTDNAETPDAPYPTSFSEIVELINSGKPIQGIKDIPDTVLEGQASQSSKTTRQKPWEKNDSFTADPNLVSDSLSGTQSKGV